MKKQENKIHIIIKSSFLQLDRIFSEKEALKFLKRFKIIYYEEFLKDFDKTFSAEIKIKKL
jgi:hypothetical protein